MLPLTIEDDRSVITIRPELGAGLTRFDALTAAGPQPVLRPQIGDEDDPFAQACNLLAPFSNRISGGGFVLDGVFHAVSPNLPDKDPYPLHGDALQREWTVREAVSDCALLTLEQGAIGPWQYAAKVTWRLIAGALHGSLVIINTGPPLPFGGGFHPWFPRLETTQVQFAAQSVWLADDDSLPIAEVPAVEKQDWNFAAMRHLPPSLIDNCFVGWDRTALIHQPDLGIGITVTAGAGLEHAMVFSPGADSGFFCFEPVSHAVDAIGRPGQPGMPVLQTGQSMEMTMTIGWHAI